MALTPPGRAPVIGYVLPWPDFGGGEVATLRVAASITQRGQYRPVALCIESSEVERVFRAASIETVSFAPAEFSYRQAWPYVRSVSRMVRTLRRLQIDLVHCSDLMGAYQAAFAARIVRVPVLCHVKSLFPPHEILPHHKLPLAAVDHFVFVSEAVRQNFSRIYRVPAARSSIIYDAAPPVDETSAEPPDTIRRALDIPTDAAVVGMVARVVPDKDFDTLIAAFSRVAAVQPDAYLLLVGHQQDRAYWTRLRDTIETLGLTNRVRWTGFRRDVPALMRAMDVVVLASHTEGVGLVILEAMAHKRPVIATRVGGIPEVVTDGDTGLLHDPQDVDGLARAILRVLTDPRFAGELAARGEALVRTRFALDRTVDALCDLYERFLSRQHQTLVHARDRQRVAPRPQT